MAAEIGGFAGGVLSVEHVQHLQALARTNGFALPEQDAALEKADSVYSAQVRALYIPLGELLARGQGGAGKAELDSAKATEKLYWKVFWVQPEIAGAIVTPSQRTLMPMFESMLTVPMKEREHSQWSFGNPVTFADKPKAAQ